MSRPRYKREWLKRLDAALRAELDNPQNITMNDGPIELLIEEMAIPGNIDTSTSPQHTKNAKTV
ncbi:hypothetical protein BGX27_003932, partial [Mortierella sp. AM989]